MFRTPLIQRRNLDDHRKQREYNIFLQMQIEQKQLKLKEEKLLKAAELEMLNQSQFPFENHKNTPIRSRFTHFQTEEQRIHKQSQQKAEQEILNYNKQIADQKYKERQNSKYRDRSDNSSQELRLPQIMTSEDKKKKLKEDLEKQINEKQLQKQQNKQRELELDQQAELRFIRDQQWHQQSRNYSQVKSRNSRKIFENFALNETRVSHQVSPPPINDNSFITDKQQQPVDQFAEMKQRMKDFQEKHLAEIKQLADFARFNESQAKQYLKMQATLKPLIMHKNVEPLFEFLQNERVTRQNILFQRNPHQMNEAEYLLQESTNYVPVDQNDAISKQSSTLSVSMFDFNL